MGETPLNQILQMGAVFCSSKN